MRGKLPISYGSIIIIRIMKPTKVKIMRKPKRRQEAKITPLIRELSGVAPMKKGTDEKKLYASYLVGKYSTKRSSRPLKS